MKIDVIECWDKTQTISKKTIWLQDGARAQAAHFQGIYPHELCDCRAEHELMLVAYESGSIPRLPTILGWMLCNRETDDIIYLSFLTTHKNSQGIGSMMIDQLGKYCKQNKFTYVYVHPLQNVASFYTTVGFLPVDTFNKRSAIVQYIQKYNNPDSTENLYVLDISTVR